jgi:uncharacterized protein (TIGR00251 family)
MPSDPATLAGLVITERDGAIRFDVRARPRAPRTKVLGVREGALHVALAAPPVDGEANDELARGLAALFGVPARAVSIVAGRTGKRKVVEVGGIDAAGARVRLASSLG